MSYLWSYPTTIIVTNTFITCSKIGSLTVKPSGRQIGRLAHSNPTIVFEVIIDSIQRMDNLAFFIADACRYLQSLSYEVLTYQLIEKLTGFQGVGKMKKKKLKDDGVNNEDWLKGMSQIYISMKARIP